MRKEKDRALRQYKDTYERVSKMCDQVDELNKEITHQKSIIELRHKEINDLKKSLQVYKNVVDEIETKFGGMNAVDDQIRTAKLKERSVA